MAASFHGDSRIADFKNDPDYVYVFAPTLAEIPKACMVYASAEAAFRAADAIAKEFGLTKMHGKQYCDVPGVAAHVFQPEAPSETFGGLYTPMYIHRVLLIR